MKLNKTIKWAIAAMATVATVAASVCIANAYTVDSDTDSGKEIRILGYNDNIADYNNISAHFDLRYNEALKQAVKFELDIVSAKFNRNGQYDPPACKLTYGIYKSDWTATQKGVADIHAEKGPGEFTGTCEGHFDVDENASGFWLTLNSYSNVEIKSIAFYDEYNNCILYGCAQDMGWDNDKGKKIGQWTFYRLEAPEITVSGYQNADIDKTYALEAQVEINKPVKCMTIETNTGAESDICTYEENDITYSFLKNKDAFSGTTDSISYNSDEGAVNDYDYVARSYVELTDTRNNKTITLYSPKAEKKVTMNKLVVNGGKPELMAKPTITRDELKDIDALLNRLNNEKSAAGSTAVQAGLTADYTDSSVNGLPDFRKVKIPELDSSLNPTGKYVYTAVVFEEIDMTDFDWNSRRTQNITLMAHAVGNDIKFGDSYTAGYSSFTVEVSVAGDYVESVKISKLPKTEYAYYEKLDLTGGELTIYYMSGESETMPIANNSEVRVEGFYGVGGTYPAAASKQTVKVIYTAADGEYDPARADGNQFTDTFDVTISDKETLQNPVISPNGGNFSESVTVTITAQSGAYIFYTTDGTTPTINSTLYTSPFTVTNDTVVKAIAVKAFCYDSEVAVARFVKKTIPTPPISGGRDNPTRPQAEYTFITEGGQLLNHSVNSGEGQFTFDKGSANKFVTMFRFDTSANKQVYVGVSKIGADGKAAIKLSGSGSYYAYIAETTMLTGDINNDGVVNALDAAAILKRCAGIADGANPAMADFNGDGKIDAFDAAEILKKAVELS